MRLSAVSALLILLGAGPALADETRLSGLPSALLGGAAAEGTQHVVPKLPVGSIQAGPATVTLGETTIADVQKQLGGTLRRADDGPARADWLCYSLTVDGNEVRTWFVSNGAAGGPNRVVTLVATAYPTTPAVDCDKASDSLGALGLQVPSLGASPDDLQQAFGVVAAEHGLVAYLHQQAGTGGGMTLQTLNYMLTDNTITGLAAGQVTEK